MASQSKRPAWTNGNANNIPFTKLFALHQLNETTFLSTHPSYGPGNSLRAYGGHVFAQSMLAAARTTKPGFAVHSITGHFLLLGMTNTPFEFRVAVVREGAGYVQRRVEVVQEGSRGVVFVAVVSFKRAEKSVATRWREGNLESRYEVLKGRKPETWPIVPGIDSPFWWTVEEQHGADKFPGLEMRKPNIDEYNKDRKTLDKRLLQYYRVIGEMPKVEDDPNLHAAGHLYASDRFGLFMVPNFLDKGNEYSAMASLSHTVIIHQEAEELSLVDSNGSPKWFCSETAIDHISHGRALAIVKLWDMSSNKPIASAMQDGLVRFKPGVTQSLEGNVAMQEQQFPKEQESAGTKSKL